MVYAGRVVELMKKAGGDESPVDREEGTYMRLIPYVFLAVLFLAAPSLASAQSGQILDNALTRRADPEAQGYGRGAEARAGTA